MTAPKSEMVDSGPHNYTCNPYNIFIPDGKSPSPGPELTGSSEPPARQPPVQVPEVLGDDATREHHPECTLPTMQFANHVQACVQPPQHVPEQIANHPLVNKN